MASESRHCVEIAGPGDPLLLPWLDLYETTFPPRERALVSDLLRALVRQAAGEPVNLHFLALVDETGSLDGMACLSVRAGAAAWLWYLAIRPESRGLGLGAALYREIVRRVRAAGCPTMVFEVEVPGEVPEGAPRTDAVRRIAFYRRLGARLLDGIHYLQYVGWHQPPLPMHVMVHPFEPMDAGRAFALAQGVLGDAIRQVGTLSLE